MSLDNVQTEVLYTPRKVQKCLFGSIQSSSKKHTPRTPNDCKNDNMSEEESDLGAMSPLALSDHSPSSYTSSPGNPLLSPCLTPKRSSSFNIHVSWHKLSRSARKKDMHEFMTSLSTRKKMSRHIRHSPLKKILPDSPKSLSTSPLPNINACTPKKIEINGVLEEMVPETPERQFGKELQNSIVDTSHKNEISEDKLITPLTSEKKLIAVPKLHRRKSLNMFDITDNFSPKRKEIALKRHAIDDLENTAKFLKIDENWSVPRARAALFQDEKPKRKLEEITLSVKSFYNNSDRKKDVTMNNVSPSTNQQKCYKYVEITKKYVKKPAHRKRITGVSHGVRKPKLKISVAKKAKRNANDSKENSPKEDISMHVESMEDEEEDTLTQMESERTPSPEFDLNKRFFKLKRSCKRNASAVVTINNKIKLKISSDGSVQLNQCKKSKPARQSQKRATNLDISFDTTDLTVDEPEFEATMEKNQVSNILKLLEDDWADDEYDAMELLNCETLKNITPLKPVAILNDVPMSPASELSSMTSIMNIEDISTPVTITDISSSNNTNNVIAESVPETRYYPIFNKGYSSNKVFEKDVKKTTHRENINWQLNVKKNGNNDQYLLDAGQKNFGATQCTECGVIYQIGDPEDENAHLNYHNNKKVLKFAGWKTERVIVEDPFTSSRIILVEPSDPKQNWHKITEVLSYVDRDLGLADTKLSEYEDKKVYLYIRDKRILGVLVAEHINTAHRMIPELLELDCCSAEDTPAKCGINVVWTDINHRKQGIARKLVDVLRAQFYYGYIMSLDDIAFSIPTVSGKIFAEKYTRTRNFKVYS